MTRSHAQEIGNYFDGATDLHLKIFDSPYINLGYWTHPNQTIYQAQQALVGEFGSFSRMDFNSVVLDVGFGTGEQDFDFLDRYDCRRIEGVNTTPLQVRMAQQKLAERAKYDSRVAFHCEDGQKIAQFSKKAFTHVLVLEAAQYFEDLKAFLEGALEVLDGGGRLCLAVVILKTPTPVLPQAIPSIREELKEAGPPVQDFLEVIDLLVKDHCRIKLGMQDRFPFYNLPYPQYLKLIEQSGFQLEEIKEITDFVAPFYPKFKASMLGLLRTTQKKPEEFDVLLSLLAAAYILSFTFQNHMAGFFFIRARKP